MEKRNANWRKNVRKEWYQNLKDVSVNGPYEVRFTLERPQPSFMSMLAVGWSAVYPCHVDGRVMRQKPVGTGPYKVMEYKPNELIRLTRNTDYWKPGLPYLDGIEYRIVPNQATRTLAFVAVLASARQGVRQGQQRKLCAQSFGNRVAGQVNR